MNAPGRNRSLIALACFALVGVAVAAPAADVPHPTNATASAQITDFTNPRQVIASGGGTSIGGSFAISGTIGQVDADPLHPASGGVYAISGGFWPGLLPATPGVDPIFANGFEPLPP